MHLASVGDIKTSDISWLPSVHCLGLDHSQTAFDWTLPVCFDQSDELLVK